MRFALDTNILAYAEGVNDAGKRASAIELLRRLRPEDGVIPSQALGELFNVLVRKARWDPGRAAAAVRAWSETYDIVGSAAETLSSAVDLAVDHRMSIWDALILATASKAGCVLLLTEDLQDGFEWSGVTVANPFASTMNRRLETLIRRSRV